MMTEPMIPDSTQLYLRDVLLKLGSGVLAFGMNFAAGVLLARVLGAEGNGVVALLLLIPNMIVAFSNLGLDKANGYLAGAKKYSAHTLLGNSLLLALGLTGLLGLAYWLALPLTRDFLAADQAGYPLLGLAFLLVPLGLVEVYLQGVLWGQGRIPQLSLVSLVRFASLLLFDLLLLLVWRHGVAGAVAAAIASPTLSIGLYAYFLRNDLSRLRLTFEKSALKDSLIFGLQAHLGNVFHFLNWRLDLFIVNFFVGAVNVGFYVVAASLAELLWYLPDAFGFVLFPKTAASDPETARRFTPKIARLTGFITALAAIGLFAASQMLLSLLYTAEFLPALRPLWLLLPGVVLLSYSKVIFSDLGGRGKPYYGTYASLLSLAVTLTLDLLLIPRWGITGAALATSCAYATNTAAALFFYGRETGNSLSEVILVQKSDFAMTVSTGRAMAVAIGQALRP